MEERKSVIITRGDLFPENMTIKEIQIGEETEYYEVQTNQKGRTLDELLSNVVKSKDSYSYLENRVARTLWEKIEGELGMKISENPVRSLIDTEEKAFNVVKEVFYGGYFKFSFPIETINVSASATPEKIKIRITSQDFPELPKSIKKVTVDGKEYFQGGNGTYCHLQDAFFSFLSRYNAMGGIAKVVRNKDARLVGLTNDDIFTKLKSTLPAEKRATFCWTDDYLFDLIWNGFELEFEISEEEIFPAL